MERKDEEYGKSKEGQDPKAGRCGYAELTLSIRANLRRNNNQ